MAEFLVAAALQQTHRPRIEWDAADVRFEDHWIEVKSAAFTQSWEQKRPSIIQFDISPSKSVEKPRIAHCYVFCLYKGHDQAPEAVLDLSLWSFFVLPTGIINDQFPVQKKVGLTAIENLTTGVAYPALAASVRTALNFA